MKRGACVGAGKSAPPILIGRRAAAGRNGWRNVWSPRHQADLGTYEQRGGSREGVRLPVRVGQEGRRNLTLDRSEPLHSQLPSDWRVQAIPSAPAMAGSARDLLGHGARVLDEQDRKSVV